MGRVLQFGAGGQPKRRDVFPGTDSRHLERHVFLTNRTLESAHPSVGQAIGSPLAKPLQARNAHHRQGGHVDIRIFIGLHEQDNTKTNADHSKTLHKHGAQPCTPRAPIEGQYQKCPCHFKPVRVRQPPGTWIADAGCFFVQSGCGHVRATGQSGGRPPWCVFPARRVRR